MTSRGGDTTNSSSIYLIAASSSSSTIIPVLTNDSITVSIVSALTVAFKTIDNYVVLWVIESIGETIS
jgi:ABC-type uncharacterized transport system auxiliary subunit